MFISQALAQAAGDSSSSSPGGGLQQLVIFLPIIAIMYLLMIRPQQQKAKKHKALVAALRRGDRVVTQGGILGTVSKVINDGELQIEIADNVRIRVLRNAITDILAKTDPSAVPAKGKDDDAADANANTADQSQQRPDGPAQQPAQPQGIAGLLSKFLGGK